MISSSAVANLEYISPTELYLSVKVHQINKKNDFFSNIFGL